MAKQGRKAGYKPKAKQKITTRFIASIPAEDKPAYYYDSELLGFGMVKHPTGRTSFIIQYSSGGRPRRYTIGTYGPVTVDQARKKAQALLGQVAEGLDPADTRKEQRIMPSFSECADDYIQYARQHNKRPDQCGYSLNKAVSVIGKKKIDKITALDIEQLRNSFLSHGKTTSTANQVYSAVRACLNRAVAHGIIQYNPANAIKPLKPPLPRNRTLSEREFDQLRKALSEEDPNIQLAFAMLIYTGCRKGELLHARWVDIDFETGIWTLPDTKAGRPQHIPLAKLLLNELQNTQRASDYVIYGKHPDKPRDDLRKPWLRIKKKAGLTDVRIHDLRRTFGLNIAQSNGMLIASKLLRHSSIAVTEAHYVPLGVESLREAIENHASRNNHE